MESSWTLGRWCVTCAEEGCRFEEEADDPSAARAAARRHHVEHGHRAFGVARVGSLVWA